jgi:hypothetical protein
MFESQRQLAQSLSGDALTAAGKSTPPLAVATLSVADVGLQDWVLILTVVYLVLQIGYLAWKWVRAIRSGKAFPDG